MSRYLLLFPVLALVITACTISSKSGEAPEPVLSGALTTSEAGIAALSTAAIDPDSCSGVLGAAQGVHSLQAQSFTSTVRKMVHLNSKQR